MNTKDREAAARAVIQLADAITRLGHYQADDDAFFLAQALDSIESARRIIEETRARA